MANITNRELMARLDDIASSVLSADDVREIARYEINERISEIQDLKAALKRVEDGYRQMHDDLSGLRASASATAQRVDKVETSQHGIEATIAQHNSMLMSRLDDLFKHLEARQGQTDSNTKSISVLSQRLEADTDSITRRIDDMQRATASTFIALTGDNPYAPGTLYHERNMLADVADLKARMISVETIGRKTEQGIADLTDDLQELRDRPDPIVKAYTAVTPEFLQRLLARKAVRNALGGLLLTALSLSTGGSIGTVISQLFSN